MADNVVMRATNVSKKFCRSLKHMMFYGAQDIARNAVGLSSRSDRLRDGEFWAVDNVSFELKRGETMGIIGPNGSGKSTMLKMLNGIFMPDKGAIEINGRVGALIEVGAGFHPMLSGKENIYINGSILGMSKKEIDEKFDEIVEFADIGDFIDSPVKHYSSGMFVRLGFAIAVHCEPEILLVDEILAVGDISFKMKSMEKIKNILDKGCSVILVSHNMHMVKSISDRAVFLSGGIIKAQGDTSEVIKEYTKEENKKYQNKLTMITNNMVSESPTESFSFNKGSPELQITNMEIFDVKLRKKNVFKYGEGIVFRIHYNAIEEIKSPVYGFGVERSDKILCLSSRTNFDNVCNNSIKGEGYFDIELKEINLASGVYLPEIAIIHNTGHGVLAHAQKGSFIVESDFPSGKRNPVFLPTVIWHTTK